MKAIGLCLLGAILLFWTSKVPAQGELPPAVQETLTQHEQENAELVRKTEAETAKVCERTMTALKKLQDDYCKEGHLDTALAVRSAILLLEKEPPERIAVRDLPQEARAVCRKYEDEMTAIRRKYEDDLEKIQERAKRELTKMQGLFRMEAKLDEAVAIRDLIRSLRDGVTTALPDPVYINNLAADIGKVFYYEVAGSVGGAIYGDGVYTTGSHLGQAAVHSGVLKANERGVVKVTILPGQGNYPSSTRNGVTSSNWGLWSVSFKVERTYGFATPATNPNKNGLARP
jgi:hypothetical protein